MAVEMPRDPLQKSTKLFVVGQRFRRVGSVPFPPVRGPRPQFQTGTRTCQNNPHWYDKKGYLNVLSRA